MCRKCLASASACILLLILVCPRSSAQQDSNIVQPIGPQTSKAPPSPWDKIPSKVGEIWGDQYHSTPVEKLLQADKDALAQVASVEIFNAEPYQLTEELKDEITMSPTLKWIRFNGRVSNEELEWVCTLTKMRGVSLRETDFSEADLRELVHLKDLVYLNLWETKLPNDDRGTIPCMDSLKILVLTCDETSDSSLKEVGGLEALYIAWTNVTDEGIAQIVEHNPELRWLNISHLKAITSESVKSIGALKHLEYLHVGDTKLEGEQELRELRRLLPGCKIFTGT